MAVVADVVVVVVEGQTLRFVEAQLVLRKPVEQQVAPYLASQRSLGTPYPVRSSAWCDWRRPMRLVSLASKWSLKVVTIIWSLKNECQTTENGHYITIVVVCCPLRS